MFVALGYIEQGSLYEQVVSAGSLTNAVNRGILPAAPKIIRCPSDSFERNNRMHSSYVGSTGPTCNNPPSGCPAPFQLHCNGQVMVHSTNVAPPPLDPPTHPGYEASVTHGSTPVTADTRGMFARGDARVEAGHNREMFNPSLISFEGLDSREISDHHEGPRHSALVVVQDRSRKDYVQDVPNHMIDRDFHFSRVPASTDREDESPTDL